MQRFVRDYTAGVDQRELRRLVDRDAPRVYSVLMRDQAGEPPPKEGVKRLLWNVRLLFLSLSAKLSPPRRLLFAASLLSVLLAILDLELGVNTPNYGFKLDASPLFFVLAVAGLLFLLATELVDRVLVRDELEVARELQRELLPKEPPRLPGWLFAHSWRTANEIGGDYLRFQSLADGRLAIVVADASGHGMAAGLLMAITDTALQIAIEQDPSPPAVAELLHRALRRTGNRRAFVTLFYGLLDPATGRLDFVSAAHPSPLVRRRSGEVEEPASGSFPAGMREKLDPWLGSFTLAPGDLLLLCTDGLFEAVDTSGNAFGWDRLQRQLADSSSGAQSLHDRLRAALDTHQAGEPAADDCSIVVVERLPD